MNEEQAVNAVIRLYGRGAASAGYSLSQLTDVLAYAGEAETGLDDYFGDSYVTEAIVTDLVQRILELERQVLVYKTGLVALVEEFPNV